MAYSPGHQAVEMQDFDTLRRLLDDGMDIQDPDDDGSTLLHRAVDLEQDAANQLNEPVHVDMTAFLLARGADPVAKDNQGLTPLALAEEHGHWLAVELIRAWIART